MSKLVIENCIAICSMMYCYTSLNMLLPTVKKEMLVALVGTVVTDRQTDGRTDSLVTSVRFIHSFLIQILFLGDTFRYSDSHHFIISMTWLLNSKFLVYTVHGLRKSRVV